MGTFDDGGHGASGSCSRPAVSGRPWTRLNAWTAWPAAPLTRLSSTPMARIRPVRSSSRTWTRTWLLPVTCLVAGGVGDDRHERLVGVGVGVQLVELGLADRPGRADVAGRQDAAGHRDEVGQEVDRDDPRVGAGSRPSRGGDRGQLLLDLGDVAMTAEAVRLDALVDLAEMEVRLRLATGARDAALGVDDEVADEPGPGQRRERQERRRRVAARRADDRDRRVDERRELGAVELGQAVDGLLEEVRAAGARSRTSAGSRPGRAGGSRAPGR